MPVIPALGRQRQKNQDFKAPLSYIAGLRTAQVRPCLKTTPQKRQAHIDQNTRLHLFHGTDWEGVIRDGLLESRDG